MKILPNIIIILLVILASAVFFPRLASVIKKPKQKIGEFPSYSMTEEFQKESEKLKLETIELKQEIDLAIKTSDIHYAKEVASKNIEHMFYKMPSNYINCNASDLYVHYVLQLEIPNAYIMNEDIYDYFKSTYPYTKGFDDALVHAYSYKDNDKANMWVFLTNVVTNSTNAVDYYEELMQYCNRPITEAIPTLKQIYNGEKNNLSEQMIQRFDGFLANMSPDMSADIIN